MLDSRDPLVVLADTLDWSKYENKFKSLYSKNGRPAKPIRLMERGCKVKTKLHQRD